MSPLKIPWLRKSDRTNISRVRIFNDSYLTINIFLAGVIVLIIAYSGIFSPEKDNYPVVCVHERITGKPCASCGLSHSISLILRGRIEEAHDWNIYGARVFIFFVSQLTMRVVFSVIYSGNPGLRKQIILFDIIGSSVLFLVTFFPFLVYIFKIS